MATLLDLVKRCPGCKRVVVWPFTQDHTEMILYPATAVEISILKKHFPSLTSAHTVGAVIPTHRDGKDLWHEPCYMNHYVRMWQQNMQKLVDLIVKHKKVWSFPWGRKEPADCDHPFLNQMADMTIMFGKPFQTGTWCGLCLTKLVDGEPI